MAKCPVCARDIATPFVLNADAWRWLACPHCAARLERKNPRYMLPLISLFLAVISLGRLLGPRHIVLAEGLLVAVVIAMLVVLLRVQLQVRKPLPEPEIRLNIGGSSKA
jgi:hypothetical protein